MTLVVVPNKTDLGVKLLAERRADLAMISTALEPAELLVWEMFSTAADLRLVWILSLVVWAYTLDGLVLVSPALPPRSPVGLLRPSRASIMSSNRSRTTSSTRSFG